MEKPKGDVCSRVFRWIPCIFISLVVIWSYYAYVIELCLFTITSITQKVFYILFFQAFFFMFTWSYWQTVFTDPKNPSHEYTFPEGMYERMQEATNEVARQQIIKDFASSLSGMELRTANGGFRYCMVSARLKPDRCHYCSVVKQCVLKMDHYCPWVNNCVGFSNYKFFVLFLFYGLLYCLYIAATVFQYFILFWGNDLGGSSISKYNILFLFFASAMFSFSLTTLFGYHLWLVMKNRTTIESWRAPIFRTGADNNGFNLGTKRNIEQVFGENPLLWGIPVFTSLGDGQTYPSRLVQQIDVECGLNRNTAVHDDQQSNNGQVVSFENYTCGGGEAMGDSNLKSPLQNIKSYHQ